MASRKLEDLSEDDWNIIEQLVGKEFARQTDYNSQFKAKNQYIVPPDKTRQLSRIMDAVRSEKSYRKTYSIKW